MFDSKSALWEQGGPLATVWIAANLAKCKSFKVKLTRRDYCRTDIVEVCASLLTPHVELTLGLSSHLLLGIVRIHSKQTHYALQESEELMKRFDLLSQKFSINLMEKPRSGPVTLPEFFFDTSFSSLRDLSLSEMESLTGYFMLDMSKSSCIKEHPNMNSLKKITPPTTSPSFTAHPRDISIEEEHDDSSNNILEDSLWDDMYFGDEDPALLSDTRKTLISNLPSSPADQLPSEIDQLAAAQPRMDNQSDLVLVFNEDSGSFEYSSGGGGGADDVSGGSGNERAEHCVDSKSTPNAFEIPYLTTTPSNKTLPTTPRTSPLSSHPQLELLSLEEIDVVAYDEEMKNRQRKKRKAQTMFDFETEIESSEMKISLKDMNVGVQKADFKKQFRRMTKAPDLLLQPFSNTVRHHVLASRCKESLQLTHDELAAREISGLKPPHELNKDYATPIISQHLHQTPTSTPIIQGNVRNEMDQLQLSAIRKGEESEGTSTLEAEVLRRAGDSDHVMSYEDPLRNASQLSGDSVSNRRNSLSFQASTASRLNHDLLSGEGRPDQFGVMGGLSPILDVEEEMEITPVSFDLPVLDDSDEIIAGSFSKSRQPHPTTTTATPISSPSTESKVSVYCSHVASVMGGRSEMEFKELVPPGTTSRKAASVAFFHVLTLISRHQFLTAEQSLPYGPITLRRGEKF